MYLLFRKNKIQKINTTVNSNNGIYTKYCVNIFIIPFCLHRNQYLQRECQQCGVPADQ